MKAGLCYNGTMRETVKTRFEVGDCVVYPGYGVGHIVGQEERAMNGDSRTFLVISFKEAENESKVMIPVSNTGDVGLRAPSPKKEAKKALDLLSDGSMEVPAGWKDRFAAHGDMLARGDILSVAQVLKTLWVLNRKKPLSFREKKMYQKALLLMSSEVALILGKSREETEAQILKKLEKLA